MLAKYEIDYIINPHHNKRVDIHRTDDPVEAEDFLMGLLASGARILAIKHEAIELGQHEQDQMICVAAQRVAARLVCESLRLDAAAVKHRFGFAV
jgi:hypothetical protein